MNPTGQHRPSPQRSLKLYKLKFVPLRNFLSLAVLLCAALVLTQCTNETPDRPNPTAVVEIAQQPDTTATIQPAQPTPTAKSKLTSDAIATPFATITSATRKPTIPPPKNLERGGTLRFAVPEGPPHTDPHLTVSSGLLTWGTGQSYSRLFKFDLNNGGPVVVCDLCSSWTLSTPITLNIKLRGDINWQDIPPLNGRTVTAQDIVFSLKRQATNEYPNASLLSSVADFTAIGDSDIVIRLLTPDSEILEKLADSHSRIVAPEVVKANGDLRRGPTIGSGPWITTESQADMTRLIVNPSYYGDIPYLDGLDIQVMPGQGTRVAGMRSKILDVAQADWSLISDATEKFEEIGWTGISNSAAGIEIAMNTARSPIDRQDVRKAMMLAWDPLIADLMQEDATENEDYPSISLGLPLLNPDWQLSTTDLGNRFNDPKQANTILSSTEGVPPEGLTIKVGEYGSEYIDMAQHMVEELTSAGIQTKLERVSTRTFGDEVWVNGNYDIFVGAPLPISSTTGYLFAIHHADGPWNTTGYSNPEIDRLITAQAEEYRPDKRAEILLEIQQKILDGSHRFIIKKRSTYWMWWDYVENFNPMTPRGDSHFLTQVWLSQTES
ncbi:MAG: ABC transporter substrate-binding protein [SAR202 cluster bacterium]|nr:ABC transporter substrate-binding protein [SAR202 cluster bacterium]|tara:strand:- start:5222 stop:7048 length:1827 start_codon:yes stop_codon:yes gene_type:complete